MDLRMSSNILSLSHCNLPLLFLPRFISAGVLSSLYVVIDLFEYLRLLRLAEAELAKELLWFCLHSTPPKLLCDCHSMTSLPLKYLMSFLQFIYHF